MLRYKSLKGQPSTKASKRISLPTIVLCNDNIATSSETPCRSDPMEFTSPDILLNAAGIRHALENSLRRSSAQALCLLHDCYCRPSDVLPHTINITFPCVDEHKQSTAFQEVSVTPESILRSLDNACCTFVQLPRTQWTQSD